MQNSCIHRGWVRSTQNLQPQGEDYIHLPSAICRALWGRYFELEFWSFWFLQLLGSSSYPHLAQVQKTHHIVKYMKSKSAKSRTWLLLSHPYHSFANGPVKIVALMWARVQISTGKTQIENKSLEQRLVIFKVFGL